MQGSPTQDASWRAPPRDGGGEPCSAAAPLPPEGAAALRRCGVAGPAPEPVFDDLARLASDICETPAAALVLFAGDRLWLKAAVGLEGAGRELPAPRGAAAAEDPLGALARAAGMRFLAAAPVATPEGVPLGALCALDAAPRPGGLSDRQSRFLAALARQAAGELERRRAVAEREAEVERARRAAAAAGESEQRLRLAFQAFQGATYEYDAMAGRVERFGAFEELVGLRPEELSPSPDAWLDRVHPEDIGRMRREIERVSAGQGDRFELSYRVRHRDGHWVHCWQRSLVLRDPAGRVRRVVGSLINISARVRAEAALAESEERLRLATEGARLGTWDLDLPSRRSSWSPRAGEIWGMEAAPSRDRAADYGAWRERVHPSDLAQLDEVFAAHLRGERPYAVEYRYRGADGDWRWVSSAGQVVARDPATGAPLRAAGVVEDITARKRAEERLAEREETLRLAQEAGGIGVFVRDLRTGTALWSPALRGLYGLSGSGDDVPVGDEEFLALLHPEDRDAHRARRDALRADRTALRYSHEFRIFRADTGEERWISSRGEVVRDAEGTPLVIRGVQQDISDRKRAEAALAESEARFRAITDAMPQMVWSARADGFHDFFNRRWYELTGTAPAQVEGAGWSGAFHPEDRARAAARWRRSLGTGEPYEIEYRLRMADGAFRWVLGRALPVRDPATGQVTRWFGTCTDIQEIVEAREVLARSREELERLAAERGRALAEAQAQLAHARRMEALGQLAGGIAHDFNNVLQAVQSGVGIIERRAGDEANVRRVARMVGEAAARGAAITRRLLAFSRRGDLRAEPVEAATVLPDVANILAHTLGGAVAIAVEVPPGLRPLLADKAQLETVLVNLAANARDAMRGQGRLALTATEEEVPRLRPLSHSAALSPGRYLRLAVSDTGPGMAPEVLAQVTEPFFTTKPPGEGTGLGLAMARGFAEQSGGGLSIASEPGRGTTVALWLPCAEPARADAGPGGGARAADGPGAPPRGGPVRVLLVDDDPSVRGALAEQLASEGHEVLSATGGEEALALLAGAGAGTDVVVTDLSMPGMDGVALADALRRRPGSPIPIILLTGFATGAAEAALSEAGPGRRLCLLRKPVTAEVLSERIASVLADRGRGAAPER